MIIRFRLEANDNDETTAKLTARVEESGKKLTRLVPVGIPDAKMYGILGELVDLIATMHGVGAFAGSDTRIEGPDLVVELLGVRK